MTSKPARSPKSPARPLACLVVEDHVMIGQLLAGMLGTVPGLRSVSLAVTATAGVEAAVRQDVDLLILDLLLPEGDGLAVLRAAVEHHPRLTCIVLSCVANECVVPKELRPYVTAIVDKTSAIDHLRLVVEDVVRHTLGLEKEAARPDPTRVLRPREMAVFERIGQGMTSREIADSLGITVHTVNSHRKAIVAALGVVGAELVRLAALHTSYRGKVSGRAQRRSCM